MRPDLTHDRLRELLSYDEMTGAFTWRTSRRGGSRAGDIAGTVDKNGYRVICADRRYYKAHRLAVFYVTGEMPAPNMDVDHKHGLKDDNRFSELRVATRQQNCQNRTAHSTSRSGVVGAHFHPATGRWLSRIRAHGKNIYLGIFPTPEMAHAAYMARARELFGEFFREPIVTGV